MESAVQEKIRCSYYLKSILYFTNSVVDNTSMIQQFCTKTELQQKSVFLKSNFNLSHETVCFLIYYCRLITKTQIHQGVTLTEAQLYTPRVFLDALASLESGSVGPCVRHRNCGSTIFRAILFSGLKDFRAYKLITLQPYNLTALQPYNLTTLQPYNLTTLQPYNLTALKPYNLTTLQPQNLTALQHYNHTTLQSYNLKTLQPYNLKPYNLTTLQPYNLTTLQP